MSKKKRAAINPSSKKAILENVYIGNNLKILQPDNCMESAEVMTIGSGTTIGAGNIGTHDIPPNVRAFGILCRVIREITEEDKTKGGPPCQQDT